MWTIQWFWLLAASATALTSTFRDYDAFDYYAVHLEPGVTPEALASHLGLEVDGPLGEIADHWVLRDQQRRHDYDHITHAIQDLKRRRRKREVGWEAPHILDNVLLTQKQELHKRFPRVKRQSPSPPVQNSVLAGLLKELKDDVLKEALEAVEKGKQIASSLDIGDPIYAEQWHLYNPIQPGHDLNVTGVWQQGITGKGSVLSIVDDGLDMDSRDLQENYFAAGSWDYNDPGPNPKPRLSDDRHGTRCAGEVAAVRNDVCGVGVAYDAKVSGIRILSKVISDVDEAEALIYKMQDNHIYSCSWGPPDDGQAMEAPGVLIKRAMLTGIQKGRGGLGSLYVFAIGNGAANGDNCNFDGYTNSIYSVSVGSIDRTGKHPYYSEACSAQLVVAYSSGSGDAIHTTDVGASKCYNNHGGTSAAGPLVAGVYALMLEVNPKLTWRDIQYITVMTAVKIDQPAEWQMNKAVGKEFSHQFGYGKADAYALVEMAKNWTTVKPQAWYFSPWMHVKHPIPQGATGLASSFDVTEDMLKKANLERIEHVTVTMNVNHTRRGDLSVELRSPSGMVSHIATARRSDKAHAGYQDWTFMSVAHWGESGIGKWTVVVKDTKVNDHTGNFTDWRLRLWGEARDAASQGLLPMPTEHDDDDHDEIHTATVGTLPVAVPTDSGLPEGNPDDHITRPVNNKIASTTASVPAATTPAQVSPPDAKPTADKGESAPSQTSSGSFLPHPFPTFGVSKKTQIWIYGAFALIVVFLMALGAWFYYVRRKKRWMSRDDYGFEMVDHDDDDDDQPGANGYANGGLGGRKKKGRRAGELYDAFAEGTDDEAEMFELGSDSEDEDVQEKQSRDRYSDDGSHERYRDHEPLREGTDV